MKVTSVQGSTMCSTFRRLKKLESQNQKVVIRAYSNSGSEKSEVDHVVGLSKVAMHQSAAGGGTFTNSFEMVNYLQNKFNDNQKPVII